MKRLGLAFVAVALVAPVSAVAQSCEDLWYERNQIYKDSGYCFRTARAISAFGNSGCQFDDMRDVPMSRGQRATVARIVRQERDMGCPP